MDNINNKLKYNGMLFIAVPNFDAVERIIFKKKWIAYDVPVHLNHFSIVSITKLLNNYNFKIIKKYKMYQDTFYNIYCSLNNYKINVILKLFLFIIISIYSLINILLNVKKSSSILYICQKK